MQKPKSLVTGACGFIGSHVVEVLAEAGHEIVATDLQKAFDYPDAKRKICRDAVVATGASCIPSDLTVPETLEKLPSDVDYIFHVASLFSYGAPWRALYEVNVKGTKNLVQVATKNRRLKRFVLLGAGGVYGPPESQEIPFREEESLPNPQNNYLRSKWMQEFFVMQAGKKEGLPYLILRPTTVYGPRGYYGGGQMLIGLASAPILAAPKNFTGRIPFVHVRDVASAALHLATYDRAVGEVYNITDDSKLTTLELFKFMADLRGHRFVTLPPVNHFTIRKIAKAIGMVENFVTTTFLGIGPFLEIDGIDYLNGDFVYSNEKLKSTGYKLLYPDPRPGIQETIQWFMRNGWLR